MYTIVSADGLRPRPLPPRPDPTSLTKTRASWEQLVGYYKTWELHERTGPRFKWDGLALYENRVRCLAAGLRRTRRMQLRSGFTVSARVEEAT